MIRIRFFGELIQNAFFGRTVTEYNSFVHPYMMCKTNMLLLSRVTSPHRDLKLFSSLLFSSLLFSHRQIRQATTHHCLFKGILHMILLKATFHVTQKISADLACERSEGSECGASTHAKNKKCLCVRLWKGDLFRSARSSFFFLSSFFFSQPESCLKFIFLWEDTLFFLRVEGPLGRKKTNKN